MKKTLLLIALVLAGCVSTEFSEPMSSEELANLTESLNMTGRSQILFVESLKINQPAHVYVAVRNDLEEAAELELSANAHGLVNVMYDRNKFLFLPGRTVIFPLKIVPLEKGRGSLDVTITHEGQVYSQDSLELVVK